MRMRHPPYSVSRIESQLELPHGRSDWRTAHEAAGDGAGASRYIPSTCEKCWHIAQALEEEGASEEAVAQRLSEEGLSGE